MHTAGWLGERSRGARWLVVPLLVGVVQVVGTGLTGAHQASARPLDALGAVLLLVGPAALLVQRRAPVGGLAVVLAATVAYLLLGYPLGPVFIASIVALCRVVSAGHRAAGWGLAVLALGSYVLASRLVDPDGPPSLTQIAGIVAWILVFLVASEGMRVRRERIAESRQAAAEQGRRQASEERLRIARELHDLLGHHISLINVQAGVALHLMDDDPQQARTALAAIKEASRDVLREMRATLGVLRGVDESAPRDPTPGLGRLDELVSSVQAAGLPVRVQREGEQRALPAGVDLAAYRIVQEALTNTRRHAGPAHAAVLLVYAPDAVTLQVDDDGRGSPARSEGGRNGIAGMAERAAALGGTLQAGPRPEGGFRVRATFPLASVGPDTGPVAGPVAGPVSAAVTGRSGAGS